MATRRAAEDKERLHRHVQAKMEGEEVFKDVEMVPEGGLEERRNSYVIRSGGVRMDFKDVCLDVPMKAKKGETQNYKRILDNVSGYCKSGEILYIMGPSGAGKTTLLDSLADRTSLVPSGRQYLDGQPKTEEEFKKVAKYCLQEMYLYEGLTVKETLYYAASFYTAAEEDRQNRVNEAMEILGLVDQADVKIGGVFYRGVSGGQRRRVTVGEVLVAEPKILFLDEPTSNLDSAAAYNLVLKLKSIAQHKLTTVICTIHQPSERVFEMSDKLLLLGNGRNGGATVFFGPTHDAGDHMFGLDLGLKKPETTSMAEWLLDEVNADFGDADMIYKIIEGWKTSPASKALKQKLLQSDDKPFQYENEVKTAFIVNDIWTLMKRQFKNTVRNPAVIWLRYAMYLALAFVIGTVWWQVGKSCDFQNTAGNLFFAAAFFSFMSISVLPAYLEDKAIFVKERANGNYSVAANVVSNFVVSTPFIFVLALLSSLMNYWFAGMYTSGSRFFFYVANLFLTLLVAESICLLVASMTSLFIVGIAAAAFVFGTFMTVTGFFIKYEDIPSPWRWLHFVAFHFYSFGNFMINQFEGTTIAGNTGNDNCSDVDISGEVILDRFGFADETKWENCVILISMTIGYRAIATVWVWYFHTGKK